MASITTIAASDVIADSRAVINTNFTNLNSDKIETSTLDTDTSLTANSDSKIATQKAVKTYVDASVNPTGRSWNEYAADAGSTDAYAITLSGVSAYTAGQTFKFKANTANTGACTLNINGLGAKTIKKDVSSDLATGDILANQLVEVCYDGTNMQLISVMSGTSKSIDFQIFNTVTAFGDRTTQFDITNPAGSTFRYTWDGTGTDPTINTTTFPTDAKVEIYTNQFLAANRGIFTITGSGTNYFEVTNASGVVESNKIINDDGYIYVTDAVWTKPTGAKAVEVICIGGGGGGGAGTTRTSGQQRYGGTGGGGGAITRKIFRASDLGSTERIVVGGGGNGGEQTNYYGHNGGTSVFGTYLYAYGGGGGLGGSTGSAYSGGSGGGVAGSGVAGNTPSTLGGSPATTAGAAGISGQGAGGDISAGRCAEYGGASGDFAPVGSAGGSSIFGGAGGGTGGYLEGQVSPNPITGYAGKSGGASGRYTVGGGGAGGASGATGTAGTAGTSRVGYGCGDGGGGGGASTNASVGGAGGAGGAPGGGGGGGGVGALQTGGSGTGGVGGNGGKGEVRVITYF